ncbi:hypothetical protein O3G_MSEX015296 [Manduca sexta]|uniref:Uncharacterized protein n=1 Tax=Manduca sexta TaxID=7130 RepID=A0A922D1Q7_MANSE|nr:hypothetical protein O3G_MSEX015296 [Manduca sexta]
MCRGGGEKVCGFDAKAAMLAVFEDLCTLYTANCKKFGVFQEVDMVVCKMQKSYEAQYVNDTFEFVHYNDKLLLRDLTA